ncbi:MAG TPA: (Fe-S)-binding protein [Bryobacteraceae bacterium]|nr:(Fe-S)-binding protein [Bryobacteraceae bacterium]
MLLISYWKAYMLFSSVPALAYVLYTEPERFSRWEMALCALLIIASIAGFWSRFGPVWQRIWKSKKGVNFSVHPLGRRVWNFFWEVLCQAKVIAQRPLPGIAHAFVFWGFCVFALVSLNHFASIFGVAFLDPHGVLGRFYFDFAGVFAVLVAVSIAGLFVRRFFIRPVWLGPKISKESGVIAGLIFLLMVTYLSAFFVPGTTATASALWWIHSLTILAFLPLIPHTKHLHLVLSPFTIFLDRNEFSEIPPLAGDEDFGLVSGKDVTQLVSLQAYSCVECGRCTEHCPASNTGKVLNPKQVILGVRGYLNDLGPASEEPLLGTYNSQEAAFQCTTCGSCEFQCPVGIQHLPIIIGLRRGAVNTGSWEDEHGTKLFLALERNGNALGLGASERTKFIEKRELPIFDGSQEYCLWLGCMGAYDPKGREIIGSFAEVMRHLGTTFGVLRKEKCTGDPVRRLGNDLLFQQLAEENLETLKQSRVTKIVSICPHCVRTISKDWRDFGEPPEIEHHSEFMARHKDKLPKANGAPVVYHDPCYLGRYREVYDQPREVLALAGPVIDPPRARERGFCCGAGGGLAFLGEEKGERVSHNRAKELTATGAEIVGAACPFCNTMLRDGLAAVSETPPQLLDIAQITAMNIRDAVLETPR